MLHLQLNIEPLQSHIRSTKRANMADGNESWKHKDEEEEEEDVDETVSNLYHQRDAQF
jgi:hypothetical protein